MDEKKKALLECNDVSGRIVNEGLSDCGEIIKLKPRDASIDMFFKSLFRAYGRENKLLDFSKICEEALIEVGYDFSVIIIQAKAYFSIGEIECCKKILLQNFDRFEEPQKIEVLEVLADISEWGHAEFLARQVKVGLLGGVYRNKFKVVKERIIKAMSSDGVIPFPVYCINLDEDKRKKKVADNIYRKNGVSLNFVKAIRGSSLDKDKIKKENPNKKFLNQLGVVGCFLSHIKAIEEFLEEGGEYALLIEDDGLPFRGFDSQSLMASVEGSDVAFVNGRMSSLVCEEKIYNGVVPVVKRLSLLPDIRKGWGGDGYVLSRSGAQKILNNFSDDKIIGHFDGQLGSYCVNGDYSFFSKNKALEIARKFNEGFVSSCELRGVAFNFPLVHSVNFSFSSRNLVSEHE